MGGQHTILIKIVTTWVNQTKMFNTLTYTNMNVYLFPGCDKSRLRHLVECCMLYIGGNRMELRVVVVMLYSI